ncbi:MULTISPECIES: hypothetical protein [Pseudoalteromonas]|jgi:hypothetical protein|uniref:Uncharacterized protein n=4 Tax=Pseudoalteromonas TaxID=53246 RepID=A0AAD0XCY5_9GAMM|nr:MULTISPECIES: hypothetical protein [Pseudoalteromonas]GEK75974.1 hypothetical protein PAT01_12780 [Pseudoalteromonas atlantica]ATC81269.1 hypothetical protein PAGA_a0752 [Pseudoalteromonas agarivorans DSM 14585]AYM87492.1 hypothetical protein D9T18_12755 [Pseudoalteromonas agarivorans]KPW05577.1 hypothetical protein AN390_00346 [Pseudoalteromonas sp. P1-11]MCK8094718.1 hypothetical protein [Pseudoalteromonas sp. 1CM17D]
MVIEAASKYYNQLNNDLKAVKKYIHNNFGVFLTILYLLGSLSGVVYLYVLLNNFSVDIFNFIEISDFLLALISNFLLITLYTTIIVLTAIYLNWRSGHMPDPSKTTVLKKLYYGFGYPFYLLKPSYSLMLFLALIISTYPTMLAHSHSKDIINERTMNYHLSLNYPIAQSKVTQLQNVQIVASTMRNLFVYDNKQDELLIISQENISALIPNLHQEKTIKPKSKAASSTQ